MSEPLASPTLALLYLAQGHPSRAQATLEEVLVDEPGNGYALALLQRLRAPASAILAARFLPGAIADAGELELHWSIPPELAEARAIAATELHLVLAFARLRDQAGLRYSSLRCDALSGARQISAPLGPASAAVTLVVNGPDGRLRTLAVADTLSW